MTGAADRNWLRPALEIVGLVTVLRLVLLAVNKTDLFVDEAQYWLWGQHFAFGYYSKPPLIGWVIGVVTWAVGSDTPFWVRMPGAVLHAATALILAALAVRMAGARAAVWVAACYVTTPFAALGSLLMSTDTIMAPFFAAALYFHRRLLEGGALRFAALAGVAAGSAFLAKYAAVYFLIGVALACLSPALRIRPKAALVMVAAFAVTILPNIIWNLQNDLSTFSHTADNVGWVREASPLANLRFGGLAEFFFSQFAVTGPVLFAALLLAATRLRSYPMMAFVVPAVLIVCVQSLLGKAYANWAVSAYFAGTVVAVMVLLARPRWLMVSLVINGAVSLALPVITLIPGLTLGQDRPILQRYLGRAALSAQIIALAKGAPIVSDDRDILADLFYAARDSEVQVFARPPEGRPMHHYELSYALPASQNGEVFLVTSGPAPRCEANLTAIPLQTAGGAYARVVLNGYFLPADCLTRP